VYPFSIPNYKGKSIVNLMSSIARNFSKKHSYAELKALPSSELKKYKNIILIIIDGLGYNFLMKRKGSFLLEHLRSKMSSVFLPTTACANTVFSVGYPAQQHGLTAWDMNLKEVGAIVEILPFIPKYKGESLSKSGFKMEHILNIKPFHKGFKAKCFTIIDKKLSNSEFTSYVSKHTKVIGSRSYKNAFTEIKKLLKRKSRSRKFIHVYFPELDAAAHEYGINSGMVKELFFDFDKRIKALSKLVRETNSLLIVTGDHGLINTSRRKEIFIEQIPGLKECLTIPLSGEARTRYVYVRPGKVKEFEHIVNKRLSKFCWCFKSEDLVKDHLFGLGKPNKKLLDRIGDYILVMKEDYTLRDKLANSQINRTFMKGVHGGVSDDEMFVPLVVVS